MVLRSVVPGLGIGLLGISEQETAGVCLSCPAADMLGMKAVLLVPRGIVICVLFLFLPVSLQFGIISAPRPPGHWITSACLLLVCCCYELMLCMK